MKTQRILKRYSVGIFVLSLICLNTYVLSCGLVRGSESSIVVWANDGGDKVTRDELRAYSDPSSVVNSVWDGTGISLFGARNEVVSFNLVIEAPGSDVEGVEVQFDQLDGPDGVSITSRPAYGDDLFNFAGRNIELFYVRYLKIEGLSTDLAFAGFNYDQRHLPERFRLPYYGYPVDDIGPYEGIGVWEDRPDHDKYYPDIAVP